MTPERFWTAACLFHLTLCAASWHAARAWCDPVRCALPARRWLAALARVLAQLAVFTYGIALLAPALTNLDGLRRLHVGPISLRLLGQALFGEAILLALGLGLLHLLSARPARGALLALAGFGLAAVYADAYRIEPNLLRVRMHAVGTRASEPGGGALRILHVTDIQTPSIGAHEERALREGLASRPDLIVLTGDYVQNALGRETERAAARDLRALMARIDFRAPLGVFATEGDVGPPCTEVFSGSAVRCLVDETVRVTTATGPVLAITGLARGTGRERNPASLADVLGRASSREHRIVISHSPDFVDALPFSVDLALAGHTHGGQVVLPFFGPPKTASRLPRRYAADLHDYRGTPLHVSRGVGMERGFDPPVRFLCPPEVCILDLRLPPDHE